MLDKGAKEKVNDYILRIKQGDTDCLEDLYDIISPSIKYIAYKYAADLNDVGDIMQEFWMDIVGICRKYNYVGSGCAYLFKAMENKSINYYNRKKSEYLLQDKFANVDAFVFYADGAHDKLEHKETVEKVSACLKELTELERLVVCDIFFMDKTIRSISAETGISKSTIGRIKNGAMKKMKKQLEEFYKD
ncbi:MAG TPA: sigma-70 family RNA polymerase sigma factor [Candidatus Faecicola pullistercoris]|nr:sigma-70 family RNA polymerase sigma factor [Candidatus Faecicola pullistercoris]